MKDIEKIVGNKVYSDGISKIIVYIEFIFQSDLKWRYLKLVTENISSDAVDLFLETKNSEDSESFWAIDDVRICNVKGKYLFHK